jgi:hypothetical protein
MDTIVKSTVTAAVAIAIAWPLLFWGHPAQPDDGFLRRPSPHAFARIQLQSFDQQIAEFLGAW